MSMPIVDLSDFEAGLGDWKFKKWMPGSRAATCQVVANQGFRSKYCLQFDADGGDDDGIFFIQRNIKADIEGPFQQAQVFWWMRGDALTGTTAWPRVVYVGPPKTLDRQDTQHAFHWFPDDTGLVTCPTCDGWYAHVYKAQFPQGLDELQVCVGWKINWETGRRLFMDDVTLLAH